MAEELKTGGAQTQTGKAKSMVKAGTSEAMDEARNMVRDMADSQKDKACRTLDDFAGALHAAARNLKKEEQDFPARYADLAADQVERLSRTLRTREWDGLIADAEGFARRNPGLFMGGAMLAGFLIARAVRGAAAQDDYSASRGYGTDTGYGASTGTTYGGQPMVSGAGATGATGSTTGTTGGYAGTGAAYGGTPEVGR